MKPQAGEVREHPGVLTDTYAPGPSSSVILEFCRSSIDPLLSVRTICTATDPLVDFVEVTQSTSGAL
jgi:hypothetical protein